MPCDTNLVLAKLKLENKELQESLSQLDGPKAPVSFNVNSSKEHLERELQRSRSKHDQALQNRQQQVSELQQLTLQCQEMLQGSSMCENFLGQRVLHVTCTICLPEPGAVDLASCLEYIQCCLLMLMCFNKDCQRFFAAACPGCRQKQSPAQRTIAQLEAQLVATGRHMQCAVSMQHYLQQAEQQHKQELSEAEAQVEALRGALGKARAELQQVGRSVCCHAQGY
jgi:chromosome segregation ATPase